MLSLFLLVSQPHEHVFQSIMWYFWSGVLTTKSIKPLKLNSACTKSLIGSNNCSSTDIISILDFAPYYFCMFDTQAYLDSSGGQSPPISYDERACEYGFLCRSEDSTLNANKITAVVDADTTGSYSADAMTTSSKIKMVITSTSFAITYSVLGNWTDTVNFFSTTFSSDTTARLLAVNNNKGSSVDDNSLTAELS